MDTSRFKRRETQTYRQTVEGTFGNPPAVTKALPVRPRSYVARPVQSRLQTTAPPLSTDGIAGSPAQAVQAPQAAVQEIATSSPPPSPLPQATAEELSVPQRRLPPMDMDLPGEASPPRFGFFYNAKWQNIRLWARRSAAAITILVITMGGLLFSQSYLKANKVFSGSTGTAAALKANVQPELLKGEGAGRINILLLGRGGGTHDAPDLTDTMMLVSIDPVNNTSVMVSIPRDLWVNIPNSGNMKINAAWQTGEFKQLGKIAPGSTDPAAIRAGFDSVDKTVESVLGVDINYNMIVDFKAFKQAVDTVGGVDVNVPSNLVDPTMAWENGGSSVLAKAGAQTFDGKHALIYVRSRETSNDFARSQRQRAVMLALKNKVQTLGTLSNPLKISGLMNAFGNNVSTDLSLSNASRLYSILKQIDDTHTTSVGLGDSQNQLVTTGNMNGQSIVLPKAGLFNYGAIQTYLRGQLKDPYIIKEKAKVLVLNGTTTPGLATTAADELRSYGYNVIGASNAPSSGWNATTLVDLTHNKKYTKNYLEKRLDQTAKTRLEDTTIPTNGADFVIIIGNDEALTTQNQTN